MLHVLPLTRPAPCPAFCPPHRRSSLICVRFLATSLPGRSHPPMLPRRRASPPAARHHECPVSAVNLPRNEPICFSKRCVSVRASRSAYWKNGRVHCVADSLPSGVGGHGAPASVSCPWPALLPGTYREAAWATEVSIASPISEPSPVSSAASEDRTPPAGPVSFTTWVWFAAVRVEDGPSTGAVAAGCEGRVPDSAIQTGGDGITREVRPPRRQQSWV